VARGISHYAGTLSYTHRHTHKTVILTQQTEQGRKQNMTKFLYKKPVEYVDGLLRKSVHYNCARDGI
jgi:hypothetical protein